MILIEVNEPTLAVGDGDVIEIGAGELISLTAGGAGGPTGPEERQLEVGAGETISPEWDAELGGWAHNYFIVSPTGNDVANRALFDLTSMHAHPGRPIWIRGGVITNVNEVTLGPSVFYRVQLPAHLGDLAALGGLTQLDYSGANAWTGVVNVSGVSVTITLDEVYADLSALGAALFGPILEAGATQVIHYSGAVPPLQDTSARWIVELVTTATGDSAVIEFTDTGAPGELKTLLDGLTSIPGVTDFGVGADRQEIGNGDEGTAGHTHLWSDNPAYRTQYIGEFTSDGTDILTNFRPWRSAEVYFAPGVSEDWSPTPSNPQEAFDQLASRTQALEDSGPGGGGSGAQERAARIITGAYTVDPADGLVIAAGSGDYNITLPAAGFDPGQKVELWGASSPDSNTVVTSAKLYDGGNTLLGDNPTLDGAQRLTFTFFVDQSDDASWRITDDSTVTDAAITAAIDGLATVASSGDYDDLANRPTLGTAAAQNTTAFDAAGAATSAVSTHAGAADPHGDRAHTDNALLSYVPKSLFDAHTILRATTDDTPTALTIGEQTLLGRITGGNIAALTPSQIRTLLSLVVGTDVLSANAVRLVDFESASTVNAASTSDVTVASCSLGSGFQSGDMVRFDAVIQLVNSSGANRSYTPKVKLGSSAAVSTMTALSITSGTTAQIFISGNLKATGSATQKLRACGSVDALNTAVGRYVTGTETTSGLSIDFTIASNSATGTQTAQMVMGMATVHR